MIQQKKLQFNSQNQKEQEFCTMVLLNICAKFGKDPTDLRDSHSCDLEPVHKRFLMGGNILGNSGSQRLKKDGDEQ